MACKMVCPNCKKMAKIENDHMKEARVEYVVIDFKHGRILYCTGCKTPAMVSQWD